MVGLESASCHLRLQRLILAFLMFKGQNNASININWGRVSYSRILLIRQFNIEVALSEFIIKCKMGLTQKNVTLGNTSGSDTN